MSGMIGPRPGSYVFQPREIAYSHRVGTSEFMIAMPRCESLSYWRPNGWSEGDPWVEGVHGGYRLTEESRFAKAVRLCDDSVHA